MGVAGMCGIYKPIKNGSRIQIGKKESNRSLAIVLDKHFNWFQKKMIHWCFGFDVEDYSEVDMEW